MVQSLTRGADSAVDISGRLVAGNNSRGGPQLQRTGTPRHSLDGPGLPKLRQRVDDRYS